MQHYRALIRNSLTDRDVHELVQALLTRAKKNDTTAAKLLLEYAAGKPVEEVIQTNLTEREAMPKQARQLLSDPDLIEAELAARRRAYGETLDKASQPEETRVAPLNEVVPPTEVETRPEMHIGQLEVAQAPTPEDDTQTDVPETDADGGISTGLTVQEIKEARRRQREMTRHGNPATV